MKEKRVTIDPSPTSPHTAEPESGRNTLNENAIPQRGKWPKYGPTLKPGEDGYRTPTMEDHELQQIHGTHGQQLGGLSNNSSHLRFPHTPPNVLDRSSQALSSSSSIAHSFLGKLQWRERIRHYTWTFFTITMATGGIANVIYTVPFRFTGLATIGVIFFLLNIALFIINVVMISLRFYCHPGTLKASILHPTERLFLPAAIVSFGTVLLNISQYGPQRTGHWLNEAVAVFFWIDVALAIISSLGVYLVMWSTESFTISGMTPIWIFPAYPLLIIGPHAAVLSQTVKQGKALAIIVGGFTIQGIGFIVSITIYSAFIYRLMTQKLPQESSRPGMFVSVGPCGFTVAGIIGMADSVQRALPADFMGNPEMVALILKVVGSWMSLWIWGLAFWFFFVSVGAHWSCVGHNRMSFSMTWYSYVFPNTALITSTFAIGKAFKSKPIQIIGCIMTLLLIGVWFCVVALMIKAIVTKQILWPQKGEDKDEGGFKGPKADRSANV